MKELEKKLFEELNRYREINRYTEKLIIEQEVPAALPTTGETPTNMEVPLPPVDNAGADTSTPEISMGAQTPPVNTTQDTPDMTDDTTEELDITDLVNITKSIKKDLDTSKSENSKVIEKMSSVFSKLDDLESKLSDMNDIINKIDELGNKIDQSKPPTPVEKLEMRSLDSYPFSQKPEDFFAQKKIDMRNSGKNEYVLTKNDVENYSKEQILKSFNPDDQEFRDVRY